MFALERMVQVMEMTQAGMVYADHYQQMDSVQKPAPVIDYQFGSLRDDFNFGSVLLFNANVFKEVIENTEKEVLGMISISAPSYFIVLPRYKTP